MYMYATGHADSSTIISSMPMNQLFTSITTSLRVNHNYPMHIACRITMICTKSAIPFKQHGDEKVTHCTIKDLIDKNVNICVMLFEIGGGGAAARRLAVMILWDRSVPLSRRIRMTIRHFIASSGSDTRSVACVNVCVCPRPLSA